MCRGMGGVREGECVREGATESEKRKLKVIIVL